MSSVGPSDPSQYLDLYMKHIYGNRRMEGFLQRAALLRELCEYGTSSLVILAICASAYRFSPQADSLHPEGGRVPADWAQQVASEIARRISECSEEVLAACIILANHHRTSGRFLAVWNLTGMISRMIYAMRLNAGYSEGDSNISPTARETRHRLLWAAFILDASFGAGIPEYTSLPFTSISIPLPIPDHCYNLGLPVRARYVHEVDGSSLDAMVPGEDDIAARRVRLFVIRQEALSITKHLDRSPEKVWQSGSRFETCLARLRYWKDTLHTGLELTPTNLFIRHGNDESGALINIHAMYQSICCILYRIAFPGFRESAPTEYWQGSSPGYIDNLRLAGYQAACATADVFRMAEDHLPGQVMCDPDSAVSIHEVIRIQLQYLGLEYGVLHPPDVAEATHARFEALLTPLQSLARRYYSIRRPVSPLMEAG